MERRTFVRKSTLLASAIVLFSSKDMFASDQKEKADGTLDLSSKFASGKKIAIKGMVLDAHTLHPVSAKMVVHTKRTHFFSNKESTIAKGGSYRLAYNMNRPDKKSEKVHFEIQAEGYKPFKGTLYVTPKGCNIHSDIWKYNPHFKPEFGPKNQDTAEMLESTFNFYLIKN